MDELKENLQKVIAMLLEDGEPSFETEFIGTQQKIKKANARKASAK